MESLGREVEKLQNIAVSDTDVEEIIELLIPVPEKATRRQFNNIKKLRENLKASLRIKPVFMSQRRYLMPDYRTFK